MIRINLIFFTHSCLFIFFSCTEIRIYPEHFTMYAFMSLEKDDEYNKRGIPTLPKIVINFLASREMRINHYLFHNLRNDWNTLDETTKKIISDLGLKPPRPSLYANGRRIRDNNSGEDSLYMHREMIKVVNSKLAKRNYAYGKKIISQHRMI